MKIKKIEFSKIDISHTGVNQSYIKYGKNNNSKKEFGQMLNDECNKILKNKYEETEVLEEEIDSNVEDLDLTNTLERYRIVKNIRKR